MRKLGFIISALVLMLGLAQCAKKPNVPVYGMQTQSITFSTGDNGAKGSFKPETDLGCVLKYEWDNGEDKDVLHVYVSSDEKFENGKYLGYMTLKSVSGDGYDAVFEGVFDIPTKGWLRFVHFGKNVDIKNVAKSGVSVDFSEQDGSLQTISDNVIAKCDLPIDPSGNYNCPLMVQFAVMKMDLSAFEGGGKTNLSCIVNNGIKVTQKGEIEGINGTYSILNDVSSNYYVVLMPIDDTKPLKFCDNTKMGKITRNLPENCYSCGADHASITIETSALPANSLPGVFNVGLRESAHFSKGNLWCDATNSTPSNWQWYFENNQWDYNHSLNYDKAHVNLFSWSINGNASGDNGYGAGMKHTPFAAPSTSDVVDWSVKMNNGGSNIWRTPSHEEFVSLIKTRNENLCKYFEFPEVKGYVILPDCAEKKAAEIFVNIDNLTDLATYNAVFFPNAGYRGWTQSDVVLNENRGLYWSLSSYTGPVSVPETQETDYAWAVLFHNNYQDQIDLGGQYRHAGYSVRLICE